MVRATSSWPRLTRWSLSARETDAQREHLLSKFKPPSMFVGDYINDGRMAPRARFELSTLRLTVAACVFITKCDDLLSY
jgi:hypothetical protein